MHDEMDQGKKREEGPSNTSPSLSLSNIPPFSSICGESACEMYGKNQAAALYFVFPDGNNSFL